MNLKESKQSNCLVAIYLSEMPLEQNLSECLYSLAEQTKSVDLVIYSHGLNADQIATIKNVADKPFYTLSKRAENGDIIQERVDAKNKLNYQILDSPAVMSFAHIFNTTFNLALQNGYEMISLAEAEDSFSLKWFELSQRYSDENPEVAVLLPLIRNSINGAFSGLLNEAAWAEGMSEEAGKVDINLLMRYNCVNPLGAIYKVQPIKEYSEQDKNDENTYHPMKESIKLSHYYEFFLRMIYNDLKVMTVPRLGYELRIVRKEVYTDSTCKLPQDITMYPAERGGVTAEEGRFWFELAKKEYFFDEDRKKLYEPSH
jgi:hypothetical protein